MTPLQEKAGRTVRLFLLASLLVCGVRAEEPKIPKRWIEEAAKYEKHTTRQPIVPVYERELVSRIRQHILETAEGEFSDYEAEIPETGVEYEMVAIEGGEFLMGSPADEPHRKLDEGPQKRIAVSDFWMGKYEVTWDQFEPYAVRTASSLYTLYGTPRNPENLEELVHWVSAPTQPYLPMDFGMGREDGYPAICMSHHAASKFCQWLSLQTGHFYRLPTEAEWEYACRAGTTGPYHCPPEKLHEYAVFDPEQVLVRYEKVGTRKPNPFGLHDMHGNVMEWCLDAYLPGLDHYRGKDPYFPPKQRYGRIIRGGSWYDTAEYLRSAARFCSTKDLMAQDPQLPKSLWWLTDAHWLGFRIVRPTRIPEEEEMFRIWNSGAVHRKPGDKIFRLK